MDILLEVQPLRLSDGTRQTIRLSSSNSAAIAGFNDQVWWPAITKKPNLAMDLWEPDFSAPRTGSANIEINSFTLKKAAADSFLWRWSGAPFRLLTVSDALVATEIFTGKVDRFEHRAGKVKIQASVDERRFQVPVLTTTYLGTGGIEGGADLKGRLKPLALGWPKCVEPVLIDATNSVYQVSAYGSIQGVSACFEGAASFGASFGNYATYAALVAANIPAGRWATCNASGLIRLGAPAAKVITCDVQGDNTAGAMWRRLPGALIRRAANNAGVADADLVLTTLTALDTAVPRTMSLYLDSQVTALDLAQEIARQCNAVAAVSWLGKLFVSRAVFGVAGVTAEVPALRRPVALQTVEKDTQGPFWRIEFQAERCWRVHSASEIAFYAEVIDKGEWLVTETYREGNVVDGPDGSRWIYINPTPTAGNALPVWPVTTNIYWDNHTPPLGWSAIYNDGNKPADGATRNNPRGDYAAGATYAVGDIVIWTTATGGDGSARIRIGTGTTTGVAPGDGTKWAVYMPAGTGAAGPAGPAGTDGVDGVDGTDGKLVEFVWRRAAIAPATPTGNGIPSGWSDDPPGGSDPLWMSKAKQELDGTLVDGESWSTPIRHDGPPGPPGITPSGGVSLVIAAASDGTITAGELPRDFTARLLQGSTDVTGTASWSVVSPQNVSVTALSAGSFRLTAMSADTGSATLRGTISGVNYDIPFGAAKSRAGSPGTGSSVNASFPASNSFAVLGTTGDIVVPADRAIVVSGSIDWSSSGSTSAAIYMEISYDGGVSWSAVGTTAGGNTFPGEPSGSAQVYETVAASGSIRTARVRMWGRRASGTSFTSTSAVLSVGLA